MANDLKERCTNDKRILSAVVMIIKYAELMFLFRSSIAARKRYVLNLAVRFQQLHDRRNDTLLPQ